MRISDARLFDVPVVRATRLSPKQGDRLRTTRPTPKARNEKLKKQELLLGWERIGLTLTLGVWEVLWKYKNTRRITQSFNLIFQATTVFCGKLGMVFNYHYSSGRGDQVGGLSTILGYGQGAIDDAR